MKTLARKTTGRVPRAWLCLSAWLFVASTLTAQTNFESDVPWLDGAFGRSVELNANTAAVGAPGENKGSVHVFTRSDGVWSTEWKLPSIIETAKSVNIGKALALDADLLVIGADTTFSLGGKPRAFVFRRYGSSWVLEGNFTDSSAGLNDDFADALAVSGTTVAVGWPNEDSLAANAGTVQVFKRDGVTWSLQQELFADDAQAGDRFGAAVALDGDTLLIGAPDADLPGTTSGRGAVYAFERSGDTWTQVDRLDAGRNSNLEFGDALALHGDRAVIGAHGSAPADEGRAYVFERSGSTWSQVQELLPSNPTEVEHFGEHVDLHDRYAVVGAFADASAAGRAYLFEHTGGSFGAPVVLTPPLASDEAIGWDVAVWGGTVLTGAATADDPLVDQGRAHAFDHVSPWSHLGAALGDPFGDTPVLDGAGSLQPESPFVIQLRKASFLPSAHLVAGTSFLGAPFKGGVFVPTPDKLLLGLPISAAGSLDLALTWPPGLPSGFEVYLQAWIPAGAGPAGFLASNGLVAEVP